MTSHRKCICNNCTTNHFPEYRGFISSRTVTLCVGQNHKKIEIHKKLLASISPELYEHFNNNGVREGTESIVCLPDEDEVALTLFTEWAYTGEYGDEDSGLLANLNTGNHTKHIQYPWPILHEHLQVYVLADRFNIPILKKLAQSEFYADISCVKPTKRDVSGIVLVIGYAYDNLFSPDPIRKFLAQYASWKLELLRPTRRFNRLILARPELLKELLKKVKGKKTKPTATGRWGSKLWL
ncbi:hypothetical protein HOY80DRAFT_1141929 [Tuber brumale]|nr:hypothetical protein HOY80DRAFT_1141929 [Tuber brumale]